MIRLLVVDDEPDLLEVLRDSFLSASMQVSTAPSGNAAQAMVAAERYDAVLTDIRMGDGTGIELIEALSTIPVAQGRPVMTVMSGYTDVRLPELLARGASDIFTKPFDRDKMLERLTALIGVRRDGFPFADLAAPEVHAATQAPACLAPKDVEFGSGGIFYACVAGFHEGRLVRCKIDVGEHANVLDFVARVRWTRYKASAHFRRGVALETVAAVDESSRVWLNTHHRDEKAVIPIGEGRDALP